MATGAPIGSWGTKPLKLVLGGDAFEWSFDVADVTQPLLGADFLAHHGLVIDVRHHLLTVASTQKTIPCRIASCSTIRLCTAGTSSAFEQLVDDFPALTTLQFNVDAPAHGIEHCVPTTVSRRKS